MKVSDIGPYDAKILIVGAAPGAEEENSGVPFCDSSGNCLKQMCSQAGINFAKCYITTIMDTKPPGNRFQYFYLDSKRREPSDALIKGWRILQKKIKQLRPNIVICLGAEPLRALTNKRSIEVWRGLVQFYEGIKIIATYHPSKILREYEKLPIAEADLKKAQLESLSPTFDVELPKLITLPTSSQVVENLQYIKKHKPRTSFDIETSGHLIRMIGFAFRRDKKINAICIPLIKIRVSEFNRTVVRIQKSASSSFTSQWSVTDEVRILTLVGEILEDEKIEKVGQNSISFDQTRIEKRWKITVNNHFLDTIHLHHCCYMEFPKNLNFLVSLYTRYQNYWSEKVTADDLSESVYNAWDCAATLECSEILEREALQLGVSDLYFKHVHHLAHELTRAQNYGVLINTKRRTQLHDEYKIHLDKINKEVTSLVGYDINLNSPKQVSHLLYEKMRFPGQYNRKTRKLTTDAESLKNLTKKYPSEPVLLGILNFRTYSKLISTYLRGKLDVGDIMRTSLDASGTKTGRISSSKTLEKTGANLQNQPYKIRDIYIARPGCVFVRGDLKQAETLVVSELLLRDAKDSTLHDKYKSLNFDIHNWSASGIYQKPESEIIKIERDVGKLSNHSGNYGAGPQVLVSQSVKRGIMINNKLGIDYSFSKYILEQRHVSIPGLKKWWRVVEKKLATTRTLTTCLGRKRIFFGRFDTIMFRSAYAFEPQGTVGDVCNMIFWKLGQTLDSDCRPLLQVHDEVVIEGPVEKKDYMIKMLRDASVIPLFINDVPLIIPIDIEVGPNWKDTVSAD